MAKYMLQKSSKDPRWWVLTDVEAQIVCRFKSRAFNETQQFTSLKDDTMYDILKLPTILREMTDWLTANHPDIV